MRRLLYTIMLLCPGLILSCSMSMPKPENIRTGDDVIMIFHTQTAFKKEVTDKVSAALTDSGYTVATDMIRNAQYYPPDSLAAIVYMAEYKYWHVPLSAKRFYKRTKDADNIVFFITSSDPEKKISKPFDAVSAASMKKCIDPAADELLARLEQVLR